MDTALGTISSHRDSITSKYDQISATEHKEQRVDDVVIIPPKLCFIDAYDGKKFNQSFTVLNCGKSMAFVRVMSPSSKAFKMKPIPRGMMLSAGMGITRNISYTHTSALALPQVSILIYINEKRVLYQIEVYLNAPLVTLTPSTLDYGEIDVGTVSKQKNFKLCNIGHKVTHFSVDLGRSDLELVVQPMKGTIEPYQVIDFYVELLGSNLGPFGKEFWIKTEPPQRVKLFGVFIQPNIIVEHPITRFKLILIDFPNTYYGAEASRTLVIKNYSSTSTMFCLVVENAKEHIPLETAMQKIDDVKCFTFRPKEGRMGAQQRYILRFSFVPKKFRSFKSKKYVMVFLRVANVHYRDYSAEEDKMKTVRAGTDFDDCCEFVEGTQPVYTEDIFREEYIQICLYGEMEDAKVKLIPESFTITYLKLNENYSYELTIQNMSAKLPIIYSYRKIACVELEPKQALLLPSSGIEALLMLRPSRLGPVDVNVIIDLFYEIHSERYKVGKVCLPLKYVAAREFSAAAPKFKMELATNVNKFGYLADNALPNNTPEGLRPRKKKEPCRTLCANLSKLINSNDEYALNTAERDLKKYTKQYYIDYIRTCAQNRQKREVFDDFQPMITSHYDVTREDRILMEGAVFGQCDSHSISMPELLKNVCTSLSPDKLMKIKISPKFVNLGQIAPHSVVRKSFHIENGNKFSIFISIKAFSNAISIKRKQKITIKPDTKKQIFFECCSHGIGKYTVPVFIIINEAHIFDATVFAKVIPTSVVCPIDEVQISADERWTYFKIYNPVNCDVTFSWDVQDKNFEIFPRSGKIPAKRNQYCKVTFYPRDIVVYRTEVYLASQSGAKQIVTISCDNIKADVGFHPNVVTFENIPLNVPICKQLAVRNFSSSQITYNIRCPQPMEEINVFPTSGNIPGKSDLLLKVTALFKNVVAFTCTIEFEIQNEYTYNIAVQGSVVFPNIRIEPEFIQIHKISAGAYLRRIFRITNISTTNCYINFCLEDYPELYIADSYRNVIKEPLTLEPRGFKELFLEFRPTEPVVYSIYLPYIINGIVGPPALNDSKSINPTAYFEEVTGDLKTSILLPETIPTVGIRCAAGAPTLKFSSLKIHFSANDRTEEIFTVTNICSSDHQLSIPLIKPESPFRIDIVKGDHFKKTDKYYEVGIQTGNEAVFKFEFTPKMYDTYNEELPLYVDRTTEKCPFNYLQLTGTYVKPKIVCDKKMLYYQTIPLNEKVSALVSLGLIAHRKDCVVTAETCDDSLTVKFIDTELVSPENNKWIFQVTFSPNKECIIETQIVFNCSCNLSHKLIARATATNCVFQSYETYIKRESIKCGKSCNSTFPFFPPDPNESFYAFKMYKIKNNIEDSLYAQRLLSKNYYLPIPDGVNSIALNISRRGKGASFSDSTQTPILPLVTLITKLTSPDMVKHFDEGNLKPAYEGIEGATYMYILYSNIISLLRYFNIFVVQLEPEYLLPYDLYVIYTKHKHGQLEEQIYSEDDYHSFTTQCWIDLFIRIYKVLVLDRIIKPTSVHAKSNHRIHDIYHKEFKKYLTERICEFSEYYENEAILLLWLQFHFERQHTQLFDVNKYPHLNTNRKIRCFQEDIYGGLYIAAVLIAYCPYMKKDLQDLYPLFETDQQLFHNSCLIYQTLKKLSLTYNLLPPSLISPNITEVTMVMCYLYDVLPGYYPKETITLKAALGEKACNDLTLKNNDQFAIAYSVILYENESNHFEVDSDNIIVILPMKSKVLRVTYRAKCVIATTAVLVLCGETQGYKPTRSIAFNLEGIPDILQISKEYTFSIDLYSLVSKQIEVISPFKKSYTAKLFLYLGDATKVPKSIKDFLPISYLISENIPREMTFESECTFNETGSAMLIFNLCFLCSGNFSYIIYLCNGEVGDFAIKIDISTKTEKTRLTTLDIAVPPSFSTTENCTCNKNESPYCRCETLSGGCAKLIVVDIPYRNETLFDALKLMIRNSVPENEYHFWSQLLDFPKGFHIFRNYCKHRCDDVQLPFKSILCPRVTYTVEFCKSDASFPKYITFDDVTADGKFQLPIHWNRKENPLEETLFLRSEQKNETRQYRLKFF